MLGLRHSHLVVIMSMKTIQKTDFFVLFRFGAVKLGCRSLRSSLSNVLPGEERAWERDC